MKNYQKVYALGHKYIQGIFDGDVLIEEKIDGSQINFSKSIEDGTINIYSRTTKLDCDNPDKMFEKGVYYILSIEEKLTPGFTYHGEYLNNLKHLEYHSPSHKIAVALFLNLMRMLLSFYFHKAVVLQMYLQYQKS